MNPDASKPACILITGPTAGGKTAISIALARALPLGGECIIADSMQVYRGMDIGTAKPTSVEQGGVPHHLLDIAEPDQPFNVDHWLALAEQAILEIQSRNRHPIIVGGTNLYIQSFLSGMMDGPEPDEMVRERLHALDTPTLRAALEQADPVSARRIHANDRRRTIRALEFHELTGEPISNRQSQWDTDTTRANTLLVGLNYPAEIINPRINARVREMMDQGLLGEVEKLHKANKLGPQAMEALGYRQLVDHLEGRLPLEEAVEQIKIRTRRFAKQQRTWLKRFQAQVGGCWLDCQDNDTQTLVDKAVKEVLGHPSVVS
ncbi:MAG: tRNA (adenosine(37)-N6)-dimethylallyltransferase MiaA [Phycisphaerales bacterium]|nr:tRNA (adenosine(37)-N6)-dimethylallyltransferase MiaA [Phycisphaerales bacterium]